MADPFTLTLAFRGICTHFTRGSVPGVPHRVVLPDAAHIRADFVAVGGDQTTPPEGPVMYYLVPHFATMSLDPPDVELTVPGPTPLPLVSKGDFQYGVRMQVLNAIDPELTYDPSFEANVPKLTAFLPAYSYASDVVVNGNAACYVDIFHGTVSTRLVSEDGDVYQVIVTMHTDGPPKLLLTPLLPATGGAVSMPPPLQLCQDGDPPHAIELTIKNLEDPAEIPAELNPDGTMGAYDYLLHYLTARGGIPYWIQARTPGMPHAMFPLQSVTPQQIGSALTSLGNLMLQKQSGSAGRALKPASGPFQSFMLTPSCSDSQYP